MRPLRALQNTGIELSVIQCSREGFINVEKIEQAIKLNKVMIAVNHASNIVGTLLPISDVGKVARRHKILLLVDAAQSAGCVPINMQTDGIDLLAFTGHKALYGPTGTGGLVISDRVNENKIKPLKYGGTGSRSEKEEQPNFLPDLLESGTVNSAGIAGLAAGVKWVMDKGIENIREHEKKLTTRLIDNLKNKNCVTVYGGQNADFQTAVFSFNVKDEMPSDIGRQLDEDFDIMCRVGLHCAPAAHKTIGTFPSGTVRVGLGALNTLEEIDVFIHAINIITQ